MAKDKLLIVDGSNLLFQMFYGMPSRIINKNGKAIQGTLGFVGALLKTVRAISPTHATVIFDGEHNNERASLNEDYKANRTDYSLVPEEETPFSQLPDIYCALDLLSIKHTETLDCEADDVIAGYALTCSKHCDVVIMSQDSDFFQLISENVSVYRYRGDKSILCTPQYIHDKLNIDPEMYADFKSLTGDASDNIKGAYKIGPKTAARLLREFGNLDNIISNAALITPPAIKNSIIESANMLKTNYRLIKLENRYALPFALDELKFTYDGTTTNELLLQMGLK